MRKVVLAGIFSLAASTSFAQTGTAPQPAPAQPAPAQPAPAPALETAAPAPTAPAAATGPANLCEELLAFMKAPPPEPPAPAAPAKPAAAPAQQQAPTQQAAPAQQGGAALQGTSAAAAKPETGSGSAQEVTGQKGVATDAPKPTGKDTAGAGSVTNAPQKDSRAAPLPPADVTSTPKESVLEMTKAEELAAANDVAACQKAAREMRVAGVAMPPPLIALAALDLKHHQASAAAQPAGSAAPAEGGQAPAPQAPAPQ